MAKRTWDVIYGDVKWKQWILQSSDNRFLIIGTWEDHNDEGCWFNIRVVDLEDTNNSNKVRAKKVREKK